MPGFLFMKTKSSLIVLIIFCLPVSSYAEESYTLDKIVVKSDSEARYFKHLKENYPGEVISSQEIGNANLNSLVEALDCASGTEIRARGPFDIQGDLSLRGSTNEEVGVSIDGIKVMDPQTGHHNLDIPLTRYDIERINITKEGSSSLYGAGSFAGNANFIIKRPTAKAVNIDALFGENALFGQAFSFALAQKEFSARVSFDNKVSKAARPNTDFREQTASFYIDKKAENIFLDTLIGYQKKDFGADSFYSNLFPEEEEHTETLFFKTGLDLKSETGVLKNNAYLRKHRDKFVLRRNNPTSVNYHTTYVYGLNSDYALPTKYGDVLLGLYSGNEEINSTNLGKHKRFFEAGSIGLSSKIGQRFTSDLRFRSDHYEKWGFQQSFNAGLGYSLTDTLKIKGSAAGAFRLPTFTDLFYSDAANKGNPDLGVEKSDNYSVGFEYAKDFLELGLSGFLRRGHNMIDWTRSTTLDPWQATNLGSVDFKGMEFIARLNREFNFKYIKFNNVSLTYSYTDVDKKESGFLSKYVLDVLKHQLHLDIYSNIFGLDINWRFSYNQRYFADTYFLGDLYIGKKIKNRSYSLEPFLKLDNFTNKSYSEIAGVQQPARWIKSGLKFEW